MYKMHIACATVGKAAMNELKNVKCSERESKRKDIKKIVILNIHHYARTGVGLSPECILSLGKSAQQQTRHLLKLLHKAIQ